jgi:hypothetical protein
MTHDELLEEITAYERRTCNSAQDDSTCVSLHPLANALRAVVELHKPMPVATGGTWTQDNFSQTFELRCPQCSKWYAQTYPCPTIQAIEKELG